MPLAGTQQSKVKVLVTLLTGQEFWAYAYVDNTHRMQDLLNGDREFLPFEKLFEERSVKNDITKHVIINKTTIASVEEL